MVIPLYLRSIIPIKISNSTHVHFSVTCKLLQNFTKVRSTSELVTTETLLYLIGNSSLPVGSLITQNTAHMAPPYMHVRIMEKTN